MLFFQLENGTCCSRYTGHIGAVNSVDIHPHNNLCITGSGDTECHLWPFDLNSQASLEKLKSVRRNFLVFAG